MFSLFFFSLCPPTGSGSQLSPFRNLPRGVPPKGTEGGSSGGKERKEGELSYKEIVKRKRDLSYPLEKHLAEWEFSSIFGMTFAQFDKLPGFFFLFLFLFLFLFFSFLFLFLFLFFLFFFFLLPFSLRMEAKASSPTTCFVLEREILSRIFLKNFRFFF